MNLYSIQRAVDYIEDNLQSDIRLSNVAKAAGYSMYHFDKLFKYTVGDSIIEYVRKRRLTEAAQELVDGDARIIDIAFRYGFSSQQSFTWPLVVSSTCPQANTVGITSACCSMKRRK